jgi:hypothetical protein
MLLLWLSIVLQALLPVALLGALALARPATRLTWALSVTNVALYVAVIAVAGLWLVLPWWLPGIYAALILPASVLSRARIRGGGTWPNKVSDRAGVLLRVAIMVVLALGVGHALAGRRAPGEPVILTWPFARGSYLVVNGGANELINAHVGTLTGERYRPYRGQSQGVDIVAIDRWGRRAHGLAPRDPGAYAIFGTPVRAPCEGAVVGGGAGRGGPGPPPPPPPRTQAGGERCSCGRPGAHGVRGDQLLREVARRHVFGLVRTRDRVRVGQPIGRVGNTGNTGEPHLHIHAQRPGSAGAPLSGEPVPISFGGRYPVRNARIHSQADLP